MTIDTALHSRPGLKQILAPVAEDIIRIDSVLRSTVSLEYPILREGIEAIISAGGKRLRPAILFLAAKFNRYDLERLLPMAAAIELLHTASLVHDDTIDEALMRRGLPTLNSFIDAGTAVLVGDYLFARSAVLSTMGGVQRATRIFAESLVTISEGELGQKFDTHHITNSAEQYYKRIYCKTAALFAAAGEIGAVLSEAAEEDVRGLRQYGRQVGMAFQIVDDILDVQATAKQLGKPTGGDLRQGTVTLPTMLYLAAADEEGREVVQQAIEGTNRSDEMVEQALQLIAASGAIDQAHAVAERFIAEAKDALSSLPHIPARQSLLDLADFVVQRRF